MATRIDYGTPEADALIDAGLAVAYPAYGVLELAHGRFGHNTGACKACGGSLEGCRTDAETCSDACRQRVHRQRRRGQV